MDAVRTIVPGSHPVITVATLGGAEELPSGAMTTTTMMHGVLPSIVGVLPRLIHGEEAATSNGVTGA